MRMKEIKKNLNTQKKRNFDTCQKETFADNNDIQDYQFQLRKTATIIEDKFFKQLKKI